MVLQTAHDIQIPSSESDFVKPHLMKPYEQACVCVCAERSVSPNTFHQTGGLHYLGHRAPTDAFCLDRTPERPWDGLIFEDRLVFRRDGTTSGVNSDFRWLPQTPDQMATQERTR